ncbi:thiamine pyrophosphate-dependent dehydrogenase E1 component subunit alpha [Verrucosispora sp. WMMD573]|uniref:thiamine pyrophosphate-dependent dehydrogenase E1 component subunit alpha n=1 Tax=Verrucosispora sp. WMMD573 TaxID=3015149 RepID=UPI00248AF8D5|nr:thiamine pyrophosphate-dependent dehydrogenase E1 component subunit alpha [Verrucosispora sp. WMMD573]WBB52475.1 thiamine pyrophosphate-dependent dehydrogenase E1 component subunit alpha [Verrucosispora sp. WMMD573]
MVTRDVRRRLYREILRVALWEGRLLRFIEEGRTSGFYHAGRGQEATAVGATAVLRQDDYLLYDHRGMGHAITKGVPIDRLFGDFLGTTQGTTGGLGAGIVHIAWPEVGVLGQSGTLGGSFPIAAGAGLSIRHRNTDQVVLCFFGDGAANRGTFHEAANAAALWKLPVIWLCENNGYAVSVPAAEALSVPQVADRAAAYGMPGEVVDGMDPDAVYTAVAAAVDRARAGAGPTLIEAMTYRFRGHYEGDPTNYRTAEELAAWQARDPLTTYPERMLQAGDATGEWLQATHDEVAAEIEEAATVALRGEKPGPSRILQHVYA